MAGTVPSDTPKTFTSQTEDLQKSFGVKSLKGSSVSASVLKEIIPPGLQLPLIRQI